jgi:hypothetical protein
VCGTIERSSCSRSQGHSRRSRRVNASRRRSASTDSADGSSAKGYCAGAVAGAWVGVGVGFGPFLQSEVV